jgi:hypothetical protein
MEFLYLSEKERPPVCLSSNEFLQATARGGPLFFKSTNWEQSCHKADLEMTGSAFLLLTRKF